MKASAQGPTSVPTRVGPAKGQGGALDVLRFGAALLIVVYHFGDDAPRILGELHPVFTRGYLATDFFLMLSGYVLGRAYGPKVADGLVGAGGFLKRRVLRIWPAHLIVLAAFVAVVEIGWAAHFVPNHPEEFTLRALALQAFLVQAWGEPGGHGWNEPTWSLSAFVVCYAAFPFVWRRVTRLSGPVGVLALGLLAVAGGDLATRALIGRPLYDLPIEFGLIRALPLFLLGMCLARTAVLTQLAAPWRAAFGLGGGLVFIGLQFVGRFDLLSILCIAAVILGCSGEPARPSALVAKAGRVSFALFITHVFTAMLWFHSWRMIDARLDLAEPVRWLVWAAALPLAILVAAAFDRYVDGPVQASIGRFRARPARYPAPARSA